LSRWRSTCLLLHDWRTRIGSARRYRTTACQRCAIKHRCTPAKERLMTTGVGCRSAARCALRQIRQRASVTSRVEFADTVVRSAAILPTFQRWKLVAISRSPGGTELATATGPLGHIHAALETSELAVGSARAVVEAPVALNGRWLNSARRSRRVVRILRQSRSRPCLGGQRWRSSGNGGACA
jgi:hypothetical protein